MRFIPVKVKERSDGDYIEQESDGDSFQTLSLTVYLDEIKEHLTDIIKKIKKHRIFMKNQFYIRFILSLQERW